MARFGIERSDCFLPSSTARTAVKLADGRIAPPGLDPKAAQLHRGHCGANCPAARLESHRTMALTFSEALVERLCHQSFLSLWSYANPRAGAGKELCDLLVVCEPDLVIFSVKEIGLATPATSDEEQGSQACANGSVAVTSSWRRRSCSTLGVPGS